MPRNGSGTYSLVSGNPVSTGTTIQSTWANNTLSDIASALTASIAIDGQTPPTNNLPMGGFKHTNVAAASASTDYARFDQVVPITGGAITGSLSVSGNLGVGTSSPAAALEIARGAAAAAGASFRGNGNSAANEFFIGQGGTGNAFVYQRANTDISFGTNNVTRMTLDASGNLGVGTSSPASLLHILAGNARVQATIDGSNGILQLLDTAGAAQISAYATSSTCWFGTASNNPLGITVNNVERMRLDTSGNLQFNSGYGSVATAYGCRAWVRFDGTLAAANMIKASGNVSSITDNSTGNYTVNFTTAMTDANFCALVSINNVSGGSALVQPYVTTPTVNSSVQVITLENGGGNPADTAGTHVAVFR